MRRIFHLLLNGHRWDVLAQSVCAPDEGVAKWASELHDIGLVVKARWGWSECVLACRCGAIRIITIHGIKKNEKC